MLTRNTNASLCLCAFAFVAFSGETHADTVDANPSNYRTLLNSLQPGDTLQLAAGVYTQGLPLDAKAGTAAAPLVIRGPDDRSAIFTARDCCNTVQLDGTSYVQVLNLTLDDGGTNGPFGVDSRGNSHHITIENLEIVDHAGNPRTVGIATEGPASNWIIRNNTIIGAGTGLQLGNADGTQPFVAGVVEYNAVLDAIGSDPEGGPQLAQPAGIDPAMGDRRTIIRHNLFANQSWSDGARANALVGQVPPSGTDLSDSYGNFVYQTVADASVQGQGNLAVHANAATVTVAAATPTVTISASPSAINSGETTLLSWTSTGAGACAASQGWTGTKGASGTQTVGPLQSATAFQLDCFGDGGQASGTVTVTIGASSGGGGGGGGGGTTTPTTPTTPPSTSTMSSSSGGGAFDLISALALLSLLAARRLTRRAHAGFTSLNRYAACATHSAARPPAS